MLQLSNAFFIDATKFLFVLCIFLEGPYAKNNSNFGFNWDKPTKYIFNNRVELDN